MKILLMILLLISLQSFGQKSMAIKTDGIIDTLTAPLNQTAIYELAIEGVASYTKQIAVTNTNNVYSYRLATGGLTWVGATGTSVSFIKGRGVYVKLSGLTGKNIQLNIK